MSELRDLVLSAIDGGARDRDAIIAETGLEFKQVSNLLFKSWETLIEMAMKQHGVSREQATQHVEELRKKRSENKKRGH